MIQHVENARMQSMGVINADMLTAMIIHLLVTFNVKCAVKGYTFCQISHTQIITQLYSLDVW